MNYDIYQSPYSWRYGSDELRVIWSEVHKRRIWRKIWVVLAEVQRDYGLVTDEQVEDLRTHAGEVDMDRALAIEAETHHDVMAEIMAFAEQCSIGGGIIHLGLTSMDVVDNADVLRVRESLTLMISRLEPLLEAFCSQIDAHADIPLMAFTHLQPAEPSTLGYRLAQYAQDLWIDWQNLRRQLAGLRGKGFKGAVGTRASFRELLGPQDLEAFEAAISAKLGLQFFQVTTQVYPRKQDYEIHSALAGLGATLYKFAFDVRLLQSPTIGEVGEPFGKRQVGSSAMPFKRNPIQAEKIDSLARLLAQFPRIAWDNAAHTLLERTLDDSANRRTSLPEAFLITDELLTTAYKIVDGLRIDKHAVQRNLQVYGPFAATERVLMALVKAGADRQEMHEKIRMHSLAAWESLQQGSDNPLLDRLLRDADLLSYLSAEDLVRLMDASEHVGDAPERARNLAAQIRVELKG